MRRTVRTVTAVAIAATLATAGTLTSVASSDNSAEHLTGWAIAPQNR